MKQLPAVWNAIKDVQDPVLLIDDEFTIRDVNVTFTHNYKVNGKNLINRKLPEFTIREFLEIETKSFIDVLYARKEYSIIKKRFRMGNPVTREAYQIISQLPTDPAEAANFAFVFLSNSSSRITERLITLQNITRTKEEPKTSPELGFVL